MVWYISCNIFFSYCVLHVYICIIYIKYMFKIKIVAEIQHRCPICQDNKYILIFNLLDLHWLLFTNTFSFNFGTAYSYSTKYYIQTFNYNIFSSSFKWILLCIEFIILYDCQLINKFSNTHFILYLYVVDINA